MCVSHELQWASQQHNSNNNINSMCGNRTPHSVACHSFVRVNLLGGVCNARVHTYIYSCSCSHTHTHTHTHARARNDLRHTRNKQIAYSRMSRPSPISLRIPASAHTPLVAAARAAPGDVLLLRTTALYNVVAYGRLHTPPWLVLGWFVYSLCQHNTDAAENVAPTTTGRARFVSIWV